MHASRSFIYRADTNDAVAQGATGIALFNISRREYRVEGLVGEKRKKDRPVGENRREPVGYSKSFD